MHRDRADDIGKPFDPETPEAFFQRGEEAFQIWWEELDPPGWSGGLELEYDTARAVWTAAYQHEAGPIMLIYDSAETRVEHAHPMGEMQLACVINQYHDGSVTLSQHDFTAWAAQHEDHIRHGYSEDEGDPDSAMVTVWIDHAGRSPSTSPATKRPPPSTPESVRAHADKSFAKWWQQLSPPGTWALMSLDRDEALLVWREAFARLAEDLEVVYDNATAYAEVIAETANLELAYIVDRFHNGRLSFFVDDVLNYWDDDEYVLERKRTEDVISLRVVRVGQDRDRQDETLE